MRVAAVDIGTNTIRLLVADVVDGVVSDVDRRAPVVGLGERVDRTGNLSGEAVGRAVTRLIEFRAAAESHAAERIRAVATSATRDAANAAEFLDRAERALGIRPDVIGGTEEAALSFRGAISGVPGPGPTLVIDPGGGSTEFVIGDMAPITATSIDIGSVRLTERLLPERPASPDRVASAVAAVTTMLAAVDLPIVPARVLGVGGTFTALAAIHLGLAEYDRTFVHGSTMTVDDLDRLVATLAGMTLEETAALPSLAEGRAPVLLGGAIVAAAAVRRSGRDQVTISESDLLDGIVLSLAD